MRFTSHVTHRKLLSISNVLIVSYASPAFLFSTCKMSFIDFLSRNVRFFSFTTFFNFLFERIWLCHFHFHFYWNKRFFIYLHFLSALQMMIFMIAWRSLFNVFFLSLRLLFLLCITSFVYISPHLSYISPQKNFLCLFFDTNFNGN